MVGWRLCQFLHSYRVFSFLKKFQSGKDGAGKGRVNLGNADVSVGLLLLGWAGVGVVAQLCHYSGYGRVLGWILYGRFWEHFSASSSLSRARANISQDLGYLRQQVFSLFSTLNSDLHSISSLFVRAAVVNLICNAHSFTCM
ncbi:uncharacterized protein K441DRAFT_125707 [Cenococcum geophilum 1.58]|uniref:uncharacterized protein n=1 Tax=Cenococcum geophilum 1.58 TaxID=794803 RepID=UPI00358F093C|nr:hypothetical protein K441DRAFT_125707 [Cenococcum geophilum 1.58]